MPEPNANRPSDIASFSMSSPKRWGEMGGDWTKVAQRPPGTGPWMVTKVLPRERVEFVCNPSHREARRIPKCERLVIIPMPDAGSDRSQASHAINLCDMHAKYADVVKTGEDAGILSVAARRAVRAAGWFSAGAAAARGRIAPRYAAFVKVF